MSASFDGPATPSAAVALAGRGGAWIALSSASQSVIRLATMLFLARQLLPEEFAPVAIALVLAQAGSLFSEFAVANAVVQRRELTQAHVDSGFTASAAMGVAMVLATWAGAGAIESFFGFPGLSDVLRVFSFCFLFSSMASLFEAGYARHLRFRRIAIAEFVAHLLGYALVGCSMAALGGGVWSLVAAHLSMHFTKLALLVPGSVFRPNAIGRFRPFRELMDFGFANALTRSLNLVANQLDTVLAGKLTTAESLGFYGRSHQLAILPGTLIGTVVDRTLFGLVSRLQTYRDSVQAALLALAPGVFVLSSIYALLFVLHADTLVPLLLGQGWTPVVELSQLLALSVPLRNVSKVCDSVTRGLGATFARTLCQAVFVLAVALLCSGGAMTWGIAGIAGGLSLACGVNAALTGALAFRLAGLGGRAAVLALGRAVTALAPILGLIACLRILGPTPGAVVALLADAIAAGSVLLVIGALAPSLLLGPAAVRVEGLLRRPVSIAPRRRGNLATPRSRTTP